MINKQLLDFSAYFAPFQKRLNLMAKRERQMTISAVIIVFISLLYSVIWEPVFADLEVQQQRYQAQRQLLVWMQDQNQKIKALQATGAQSTARFSNQSTSSLVELSAQSMGVKAFIKKQSSDKKGVKIELEQADFNRVILWLNDLQQKYGIQTSGIKIEKQDKPGSVSVQVTLERDAQ